MSILPHPARHSLERISSLLKALLPSSSCLLCGNDSGDAPICPACAGDLPRLDMPCCPQCSLPTTYGERCGGCLKKPPHFDVCHALFSYDFPADRLIHALKYGHQLALAGWLAKQIATQLPMTPADLIMPVPLHPARLRERGFNQSMEIARQLGKCLEQPVDRKSLIRSRPTPPQAELHLKARRKNVQGAFECRSDLTGKHILLVDDVMTTGASADECARTLKLHGAQRVEIVVAARALKH